MGKSSVYSASLDLESASTSKEGTVSFGGSLPGHNYGDGSIPESHLSFNKWLWERVGKPEKLLVAFSDDSEFLNLSHEVSLLIEAALEGTEGRRGVWTDRDYLVHVLACLTDSDRARKAGLNKPKALLDENKPLKHKDDPWWWQYEKMANDLEAMVQKLVDREVVNYDNSLINLAADDIRTLVDGLRDLERKLGKTSGPDPTVVQEDPKLPDQVGPGETGTFAKKLIQPEDDSRYREQGGGGILGRNAGWE